MNWSSTLPYDTDMGLIDDYYDYTHPLISSTGTGPPLREYITNAIQNVTSKGKEENKEEDNMDFMKDMFGPVKGGLCRLSMDGNIAIKANGGYRAYEPKTGSFVNCDNFVFDIGDEMFFVIPTNDIKVGDIIIAGTGEARAPRYVLKVEDNRIEAINYKNGTVEVIVPERHMFMGNIYFYGKIVSLFGNGAAIGGDGNINAENVMKYMMMSQMLKGGSGANGMNPMAMMLMMNGGFGDMFKGILNPAPKPAEDK